MIKVTLQSALIILSFAFVFFWQQSPASAYTMPTVIGLVAFYIVTSLLLSLRTKHFSIVPESDNPVNIFVLSTTLILLVTANGGINSPFFYLFYFLAFGLALVFSPSVVFVYMISAGIFFLPDVLANDTLNRGFWVTTLFVVAPLAYFFGKEFHKTQQAATSHEILASNRNTHASSEPKKPHTPDIKEIEEILEQSGTTQKRVIK